MRKTKPIPKLTGHCETDFWSKVAWRDGDDQCWEWQGETTPKGYGKFFIGSRTVSCMGDSHSIYAVNCSPTQEAKNRRFSKQLQRTSKNI